jgi:hypothetical protein
LEPWPAERTSQRRLSFSSVLDLPDPLPGDPVDLADLVQGLGLAVGQPKPHGYHAGLAFGERVEHRAQLLLQQREGDRVARQDGLGVLDQIAELLRSSLRN